MAAPHRMLDGGYAIQHWAGAPQRQHRRASGGGAGASGTYLMGLQQAAGNEAVQRLVAQMELQHCPPVQRLVQFHPGTINQTLNMVDPLIPGTDFGTTFLRLNGTEHPNASLDGAVVAPGLRVTPLPAGGAHVSVTIEPINIMSYRMELPSEPPWNKTVSKHQAGYRVRDGLPEDSRAQYQEILAKYMDHGGETDLRATGAPDDRQFRALVRQHEDVHVSHIQEAFDHMLTPWDARIRGHMAPAPPLVATAAATAREEFYRAVGFDPQTLGGMIEKHFRDSGNAFHGRDEGASPHIDSTAEEGFWTKSLKFRWRHPLG